jgi:hypothetical protein
MRFSHRRLAELENEIGWYFAKIEGKPLKDFEMDWAKIQSASLVRTRLLGEA